MLFNANIVPPIVSLCAESLLYVATAKVMKVHLHCIASWYCVNEQYFLDLYELNSGCTVLLNVKE